MQFSFTVMLALAALRNSNICILRKYETSRYLNDYGEYHVYSVPTVRDGYLVFSLQFIARRSCSEVEKQGAIALLTEKTRLVRCL